MHFPLRTINPLVVRGWSFGKQWLPKICHGSRSYLVCKALVFGFGNWTEDQVTGCVSGGMYGSDLGALFGEDKVEGEESVRGEISCRG